MCNSQLWHRSESTCIPRKVFSVQKSDETSYPIMCSQSQDMLLLSHRGLPQSQYIYGNHPPPPRQKHPGWGSCITAESRPQAPCFLVQTHDLTHSLSAEVGELRSEAMRWFVQELLPRVLPQSGALTWGFPPGVLRCCPSPLWSQLTSQMDPLWLDQLPLFILCTVQTIIF